MGEERRAQLRAGAVVGVGLVLALAAMLGPAASPGGDPGASLSVRLPDAVRATVLVLLALSTLLLLALQRPRRPAADDPLAGLAYQSRPAWMAVLSLLPFVGLLALAWYFAWHRWSGDDANPIERAITAVIGLLDLLALARKPPTSVPFFDYTIATLVLLLALGLFVLMVLVTLAGRLEKWWPRGAAAEPMPAVVDPLADVGDLRAVADARVAIVRAYHRLERALAGARAPRAPWQTPAEFMRTPLGRLAVPAPPVARLTALFELARFSDRSLDAAARDEACDCLDAITTALASEPPPRSDPDTGAR